MHPPPTGYDSYESGEDRSDDSDFQDSDSDGKGSDDEEGADGGPPLPVSATGTIVPYSSASSARERERLYGGKVTRTKLLQSERLRVPKKRRHEVPNTKNCQQARGGKVKAFTAQPHFHCCKRQCAASFTDPKCPQLVEAREPLYDPCLSRTTMRALLQQNAIYLLTNALDGKPVCMKMACIAFSCSLALLIPNTTRAKGTQGDCNRRRSKGMFSVMAWFKNEMELADVMPDTGVCNLAYPRRQAVFERFWNDCREVTT
jgi:hypothetical protein